MRVMLAEDLDKPKLIQRRFSQLLLIPGRLTGAELADALDELLSVQP